LKRHLLRIHNLVVDKDENDGEDPLQTNGNDYSDYFIPKQNLKRSSEYENSDCEDIKPIIVKSERYEASGN
jgi:hypothetical protein